MIEEYARIYRRDLTESVIPFWLDHSLDKEFGGYFTCLDREGGIYDTKKYLWLQGREVWTFSRLYNEFERKQEYLDAAALGVDFIRRYGRDPKGRVYFSLTREGKPFAFQRKPYGAVFCMMGFLEYYRATGKEEYLGEAVGLFWDIVKWLEDPTLTDRPAFAGQVKASTLADPMVLALMALELHAIDRQNDYTGFLKDALKKIKLHYDAERKILIENVPLEGDDISDWPEGRLFLPGHSIEVAWIMLHILEVFPDESYKKMALDIIAGSLEYGWDEKHGGLLYYMDIDNRPVLLLEQKMKLWWAHAEAIYATILAYDLSREDRWLTWLDRVHSYTYDKFVDEKYGEWFGYCDRQGELTNTCKGGNYKGCFHVPRMLLFSLQRIERMNADSK